MDEHYKQYLVELHSRLVVPEEVLMEALRDVTKSTVRSRSRIISGEANEVYETNTFIHRGLD